VGVVGHIRTRNTHMKNTFLIILIAFSLFCCKRTIVENSLTFNQKQRQVETSFLKNVRIDSIKVGFTTITDLQKTDYSFKEINDKSKNSLIAEYSSEGERFYTDSTKQIHVGTYENSVIISAVWLLDNYKGNLLGKEIDLSNYTVGKMIKDFPDFKWSTTGVADFWFYKNNINNDTTVFFVKLDSTIERFPFAIDSYINKPISGVKIEMSAWKIYGPEYGLLDTVLIKPLYSPLDNNHTNYYLYRRKPGLKTTLTEMSSTGKKTIYEKIKIGEWLIFNPDHTLKSIEYYRNGKLEKIVNTPHNNVYTK
jgi:hypothetical protein